MSSFRKPITVLRTSPGAYGADGNWVEGTQTTLTLAMSVQPLSVEEMDALPEGRRNSKSVKIYSGDELLPADQTSGQNADIVVWIGKNYEVVGCNPYQMGVIPHYKSYAVEVTTN